MRKPFNPQPLQWSPDKHCYPSEGEYYQELDVDDNDVDEMGMSLTPRYEAHRAPTAPASGGWWEPAYLEGQWYWTLVV